MAFEPGTVADELLAAIAGSRLVSPLTGRPEGLTVAQAYEVTRALRERRLAKGERLVVPVHTLLIPYAAVAAWYATRRLLGRDGRLVETT